MSQTFFLIFHGTHPPSAFSDPSSIPNQGSDCDRSIPPRHPFEGGESLQTAFGFPDTTREALKQLIAEGLVEQIPYRGVVVCNPDQASIEQMLELLGALEGFAGEMACLRATPEEIDAIRVLTQQMHETYENDERLSYYKINQSIHRSIVEFSKNGELIRSHERLNSRLYRIRFLSNRRTDRWHTAIEEHDAILRNLEQREGLKLNKLLRDHLGHTWTKVKDLYDS